ncbi:hypothetical protein WJX75_003945 [Coccomyxa subellipsoidea]|uniref:Protein kinase domain-containing protein n=1 Tax=Coccomyxa subellipsoidea TaxID=248742 RepID=A0ABR2Z4K3_9CHLO
MCWQPFEIFKGSNWAQCFVNAAEAQETVHSHRAGIETEAKRARNPAHPNCSRRETEARAQAACAWAVDKSLGGSTISLRTVLRLCRLQRLVGCGSFGRIYKGQWQGQQVAIKVLSYQQSSARAFEAFSECLVSQRLHHPNVVKTHKMPASLGAEAGAFALAAAAAVSFEARASPPLECAWEKWTAKDELRGILGENGAFVASRAVSTPLAPSPFDVAVQRALTDCNEEASTARTVLAFRSFSADADVALNPQPADLARFRSGERKCGGSRSVRSLGSMHSEDQSGWQGSSWSTGGDPPLPRLPLQPPRWDDGCSDGDSAAESRTLLVMEYADQRSLHTSICRGRLKGELEAILLCARDVASGMAYLHSKGVVHADLKPANILLKSAHASADDPRGFTCKIADFGMARVLGADDTHVSAETLGSLPYLAPEVLQHNKVTKAGDVYSFAILLLEMWTGSVAYQDQNYHGVLYSIFCGNRPQIPADMPAAYRVLLEDCWAADAKLRPTFEAVLSRIAPLLAAARAGGPR